MRCATDLLLSPLNDPAQGASASWAWPTGSRRRRRCCTQQSTTRCTLANTALCSQYRTVTTHATCSSLMHQGRMHRATGLGAQRLPDGIPVSGASAVGACAGGHRGYGSSLTYSSLMSCWCALLAVSQFVLRVHAVLHNHQSASSCLYCHCRREALEHIRHWTQVLAGLFLWLSVHHDCDAFHYAPSSA